MIPQLPVTRDLCVAQRSASIRCIGLYYQNNCTRYTTVHTLATMLAALTMGYMASALGQTVNLRSTAMDWFGHQ